MMTAKARETAMMARFGRAYWLFGVLFVRQKHNYRLRWIPLLAIHAVFPLLALVAGWADGTFNMMKSGGRGVFEHYGFHVLFLSAPVLAFLSWRVATELAKTIAEPMPRAGGTRTESFVKLQRSIEDAALCRTPKAKTFLALARFVGIAAVVANAASTRMPQVVYGQDVFDSSSHSLGYLAGRLFLGYYWIYLLPLVAYLAAATIFIATRVANYVDEMPDYEIRCFAADGCGGFKELGRLMTLVVYLWVPIVADVIALKETHTNFYATLKLSAILVIVIPAQLFLPFLRLHRVLVRLKTRKLAALERFLTSSEKEMTAKRRDNNNAAERSLVPYVRVLAGESVYRHAMAMTTWPYIRSDVLRWLTPFVPLAVSATLKRLGLS